MWTPRWLAGTDCRRVPAAENGRPCATWSWGHMCASSLSPLGPPAATGSTLQGEGAWTPGPHRLCLGAGRSRRAHLAHAVTTGRAHVGTSPTADPLPPPPKVTPGPWPHAIMVFVTTQGPETDGPGLGQLWPEQACPCWSERCGPTGLWPQNRPPGTPSPQWSGHPMTTVTQRGPLFSRRQVAKATQTRG